MADLLKNVFGGSQNGQPAAKADSGKYLAAPSRPPLSVLSSINSPNSPRGHALTEHVARLCRLRQRS